MIDPWNLSYGWLLPIMLWMLRIQPGSLRKGPVLLTSEPFLYLPLTKEAVRCKVYLNIKRLRCIFSKS